MPIAVRRLTLPVVQPVDEINLAPHYPLEAAAWIWHPALTVEEPAILRFTCAFGTAAAQSVKLHVSADQRYQLYLDGQPIGRGPDRGEVYHWAFASYEAELPAGQHLLEATVWWVGDHAPIAQISWRGGFVFAAEGPLGEQVNTGTGNWRVQRRRGWRYEAAGGPRFVGDRQELRGPDWFTPEEAVAPKIIVPPLTHHNQFGSVRLGWRLHPSRLPDQLSQRWTRGRVRAILPGGADPKMPIATESSDPAWEALLRGEAPLTVPAHTTLAVLIDLDDYLCAYPHLTLGGGQGASVAIDWCESLYNQPPHRHRDALKEDRNQVAGKYLECLVGDSFIAGGGLAEAFTPAWFRAGRYVLVTVVTADQPLTVAALAFEEVRYPLANESRFVTGNDAIDGLLPMLVRGMQMCSHETYFDCPHYEQLMYVGDTRVEMLTGYAMTGDDRLTQRGIELFNWSRLHWGFVAEHFPGRVPQQSATYALIWPLMVQDFALWRDDPAFVREQLVGLRGNLECLFPYRHDDGLVHHLPGWSFVDWVHAWPIGVPPTADDQCSAVINLHLVLALQAACNLEKQFGDALLAERCGRLAKDVAKAVRQRFWNPKRQLLADDSDHRSYSEHANCLALLANILEPADADACFAAQLAADDLHRASIYFSFYLLETFKQFDRGDLILGRLAYWQSLRRNGLRTPQEAPEPTRSDCHAWGSHPLFHFHASLAGVRPNDWSFASVDIAPSPGPLPRLTTALPHPHGEIALDLSFANGKCKGTVNLPPETTGIFRWQGRKQPLRAGANAVGQ